MGLDPNIDREPIEFDLRTVLLGRGVFVIGVTIPAEAPAPFAGTEGLIFQFGVDGITGGHVRVFVPQEALDPNLAIEFASVLADLHNPEAMAESAMRARAANLRAGNIPGHLPIHCPGCGLRLFGAVANRGGCLACYPDLPDGIDDV